MLISSRAFNFGEFDSNGKASQPIPPSFEAGEAHFAEFSAQCRSLCLKILRLFAQGLKVRLSDELQVSYQD